MGLPLQSRPQPDDLGCWIAALKRPVLAIPFQDPADAALESLRGG